MRAEFVLSEAEYADYAVFAASQSRLNRPRYLRRRLVMFTAGPVGVLLDLALGFHPDLLASVGNGLGLLLLAVASGGLVGGISWWLAPAFIRWTAKRRFRDGTFAAFRRVMTVEIAPDGIHAHGGAGDSFMPWSAIVEVDLAPEALYFFLNSLAAVIVPQRAFAGREAIERALRLGEEGRRVAGKSI